MRPEGKGVHGVINRSLKVACHDTPVGAAEVKELVASCCWDYTHMYAVY